MKKGTSSGLAIVGILLGLLFLSPFYLLLINAVKTFSEITLDPLSLPAKLQWNNFIIGPKQADFLRSFTNSSVITLGSLLGMLGFGAMAAWQLARSKGRWAKVLFFGFLASMNIPFQSLMLPLTALVSKLGLSKSYVGIILTYWGYGLPLAVFLYYGFISSIPLELEESAILEGASPGHIFVKILFPLLRTITLTAIILQSLWVWNDFLLPSLILGSARKIYTIPLSVNRFFSTYQDQWDKALPVLLLAMLPVVVLSIMTQRFMVKGISGGSIK